MYSEKKSHVEKGGTHEEASRPTALICEKLRMLLKNHIITVIAIAHTRVTSVPPRIV